jgi:hypothetical protein
MASVANPPTYRKVFFAQLEGLSGTLAQLDDQRVFFFHPDSGDIREVTSWDGLVVLGEVGLANLQYILDEMRGSYAKIACTRLQSLKVDWTLNADQLSLAHAVAVFPFGEFAESGDATPDNVTKKVAPHFRRVALTRAAARALRLALGIDLVAAEELSEE